MTVKRVLSTGAFLGFFVGLILVILVGGVGYVDYIHDKGMQNACEDAYGSDAEWVSAAPDRTVICETDAGLKRTTGDLLPVTPGTYVAYLEYAAQELPP